MSPLTPAQAEAYLEGLALRVQDAVNAHNAESTPSTLADALGAVRAHRTALVSHYGVECPACGGDGEVPFDILPASIAGPEEIVPESCYVCRGKGRVLPKERTAWLAVRPPEED